MHRLPCRLSRSYLADCTFDITTMLKHAPGRRLQPRTNRERTSANAQLPPSRSPATAPLSAAPSVAASTRWSTSARRTTTTATAMITTATRSLRTSPTSSSPSTTRRGLVWPGQVQPGGASVGPMDSRRRTPFQETRRTRARRRAIQEIFSRPRMLGEGPCRILSICGRCIEVLFSAYGNSCTYVVPPASQTGDLI